MEGIIVLISYFVIMMLVTILLTKKEKNIESFHVADRNMNTFSSAMSIAATWIWAPALFVSAEKAYLNGWVGLFWFLVPNVLCLILFIPFAKKIREQMPKGITLSGYMYNKYKSKKVKNIYLFQLTSLTILSTAVQLLAGGKILSSVTGIPFFIITIVLSVIALSYSTISGIRASVITDTLQMVLILIACLVFVPWALSIDSGMQNLMTGFTGVTREYTSLFNAKGLEVFFAFGLPTAIGLIAGPFGDQCFWQRTFSIKKEKIGKSFMLGAILFGIVPLSMGILGFISAGSQLVFQDSSIVNFELITQLFPKWVVLPFLFMLISGLLSTVDSNLCAIASLTTDITKIKDVRTPKIAMIILLIIGILIANIKNLSVTDLFLIYGTLRATTLLPTVMTLKNIKLNERGIYFGIIASLVIGLPIFAYGTILNISLYKTLGSLITVATSGIVALCVTKRSKDNENCIR
ncbi:TPA: hypothetical protein KPF33_000123 [Clostridioides difficile]|nr:hypothetical protein [Clostridioides difficile]